MDIEAYIKKIVKVFVEEINDDLVGVYLHGSLAMGCFNPNRSDVDILVVVTEELPINIKKSIINKLLKLTKGKRNQLEMSIILERYVKDFVYPTPFELHYFHPQYLQDENFICGGEGSADPDLAGHMMVTYHRGVTLVGRNIKDVFLPIEKRFYLDSIINDIKDAPQEIKGNPIYFALNLCRVMQFLKEEKVSSKREGGEWGKSQLPEGYKEIVSQCLNVYNGEAEDIDISNEKLIEFADWMVGEINRLAQHTKN
ncbi:aminoglycoside adenylyltransferase domain-containing protein [Lederbergia citrea]|uniref:aminoglycoside adenylyltransferase domain-containing protein n=1 Tax=Lederbergia citrea TaxID=2833581 RepID=UPI001BC94FBE|nr:aminoglycoside adenylyltransferase domain-containing protein [Lederbergia citrea]MBS4177460.1 DUF4111 domain-containing protein [Lederbergia citrea]